MTASGDVKPCPRRDAGLDVVKALAMFLVVFVHVRDYASLSGDYAVPIWLENASVVAAMPPFFMLSGMFSRRLLGEMSVRRLALRLVAYLWPVVTMIALAGVVLRLVMGGSVVPPCGFVTGILSLGWFFFCLSLCEAMTFAVHVLSRDRIGLRIALLIFGYIVLWSLPYKMFHAVEMLPFFWFGVYALPRLRETRCGACVGLAALAVFVAASCTAGDFRTVGLYFNSASMNLLSFSGRGFLLMVGRIALGLSGGLGLIALVDVAARRFRILGCLACFGVQTLGIFFIHIHLLVLYYGWVGWTGGGLAGRFALSCAVFLASYGLAVLTQMNAVVGAILWNPLKLVCTNKREAVA